MTDPTCQNMRAPSEPPLAKRPSWQGCQETLEASFLCPRKTCISSRRLRMSKSFNRWSRDAVASQLPLRFHFKSMTVLLWACLKTKQHSELLQVQTRERTDRLWRKKTNKVVMLFPAFGSHSLMGCWLSLLPDATNDFWGCQSTHLTSAPCPIDIRNRINRPRQDCYNLHFRLNTEQWQTGRGARTSRFHWVSLNFLFGNILVSTHLWSTADPEDHFHNAIWVSIPILYIDFERVIYWYPWYELLHSTN